MFFLVWGALATTLSILMFIKSTRVLGATTALDRVVAPDPPVWPKVSIIVPACNEGDTLEAALRTLCAVEYPDLEIVVVDDRSTDSTGEILDRVAKDHPRITPVHVKELPPGWLGKVHALERGRQAATGDWLLFTDADVHFSQSALRHAVAAAEDRSIDHLTLFPRIISGGFFHSMALASFGGGLLTMARLDEVEDPESDAFCGIGAFNLVRRSAFERTEGLAWLALDIADDMAVGMMMKRSGAKQAAWFAAEDLSVVWYPSLTAMVHGLEKNTYAILGRFSLLFFLARMALFAALIFGPLAPLVAGLRYGWIFLAALLTTSATSALFTHRILRLPWLPLALTPVGSAVMLFISLRSGLMCWLRGGVSWRGTRYSFDELRQGQRVKF